MIAFGDVDEVAQVYAEMTGELDELTVGQKNLVKKKNKKKKSLMPFDFNAYFISLPKL